MSIRYLNGVNIDSNTLVVNAASDRVGIGTDNPSDKLQVVGGVTFGSDTIANNRSRIYESFGLNIESGAASRPIIFRTNLIERMRITDAGNVGIGTTNPLEKLSVDGSIGILSGGVQEYHIFYGFGGLSFTESNVADGRLFLKDGGNVGIGTTSPSDTLDLYQAANTTAIRLTSAGVGSKIYRLTSQLIGVSNAGFGIQNATDGRYELAIDGSGNVGIGTTSPAYKLDVSGVGNFSNGFSGPSSETGYRLKFYDNGGIHNDAGIGLDGSAGGGEVMWFNALGGFYFGLGTGGTKVTISNAGNVGIGTTSPSNKLHVVGSASADAANIRIDSTNEYGGLYVTENGTFRTFLGYGNAGTIFSNAQTDSTALRGANYLHLGASSAATITINGGNDYVGIGTTSPSQKLEVAGALVVGMTVPAPFWNAQFKDFNDGSGIYISSVNGGGGKYIAGNAYYYNSTLWRSDKTVASAINLDNGTVVFYTNSGLTPNVDYSPTERMRITSSGLVGIGITGAYIDSNDKFIVSGGRLAVNALDYNSASFNRSNAGSILDLLIGGYGKGTIGSDGTNINITAFTDLILSSGSSECMRITSAGNVGIGTTSPGAKLEVNGNILFSTKANSLIFGATGADGTWGAPLITRIGSQIIMSDYGGVQFGGYDGSAYGARMTVLGTGNVGIGTTSPTEILELSTTTDPKIRFVDVGNTDAKIGIVGSTALGFEVNGSERMRIASTGATRLNAYGSGSFTGTVAYNLAVDSSGNIIETAGGVVDGSGTANYVSKWQDANTLTISQLFDNGTDVGIGTSSPFVKFDVRGEAMLLYRPAGNAYAIYSAANNTYSWQLGINNGSDFIITGGGFTGLGTERLRITSDGNVGIGTTSPTVKLQVDNNSHNYIQVNSSVANVQTAINVTNSASTSRASLSWEDGTRGAYADLYSSTYLSITTQSSEKMRITSAGNVGIGTTSTFGRLQISGTVVNPDLSSATATGVSLVISNSDTGYGTMFATYGNGNGALQQRRTNTNTYYDFLLQPHGGNVGIGTTAPQDKLTVKGATNYNLNLGLLGGYSGIYVYNDASSAYNHLRIDASPLLLNSYSGSNVAIAAGSAVTRLTIGAYSGSRLPYINGTVNTFDANGITVTSSNTANAAIGGGIDLTNNVHSVGSFSPLISFSALSQSGTYNNNYAAIYGILAGDSGDGNWNSGHLVFATALAYGASEKMRITNAGNVGIGTTSPSYKLDVNGDVNIPFGTSNGYRINGNRILSQGSGFFEFGALDYKSTYPNISTNSDGTFRIQSNGSTLVTVNQSGNVGIGTTSPATKLHVVGYSRNDGGLLLNGSDADYREMIFTTSSAARWNLYAYGGEGGSNAGSVLYLARYADNGDYIANVATFLRTNGYVGIATTTPTQQLHVTGNIRVTGAYYDSNNSAGSSGQVLSSTGSGTDWVSLSEITGVDGTGTANYIAKWSDADTITNSQVFDNGTNVGINNASPKTKLDVNGAIGFGSKTLNISDTFVTVLTVNMSNHTGCYVKITAFGDWNGHSAVAYLGEFFLQNGASAYNEPGVIIRQVDNTNTDDVVAQIVDPAGTGTRDFEIQLKTTSASGVPFSAAIQYEVRGQYNSVS